MLRHLTKRSGIYYYRRTVQPLAPISSVRFKIILSLRSHVKPVALFRAAIANTGIERMTALLHNDPTAWSLDERTLNEAVRAVIHTALAEAEQDRILSGEISPFEVQCAVQHWRTEAQRLSESLARRSPDAARPFLERLTRAGLLPPQLDPTSHARVAREVTKGLIRASEENARRETGIYDAAVGASQAERGFGPALSTHYVAPLSGVAAPPLGEARLEFASAGEEPTIGAGVSRAPLNPVTAPSAAHTQPDAPATTRHSSAGDDAVDQIEARAALPITEAMEKALARSKVSDHTKKGYRSSAKLFAAFFGDIAVRDVTDDMALSFREKMLDVPAGYPHDARFRGLSFPEMIDAADELDDEFEAELTDRRKKGELTEAEYESALEDGLIARMTKKTACKHLSAMNCIWTKFINAGATPSRQRINPFGGLIFSVAERNKDRRVKREFEGEELVRIFSSRPFREEMARAPEERSREFWITTCVAFTGARREEIAQLRLEDLNLKASIPHFSFKEGKGQSLKTERATRAVPVHPFLIHLGLEAFVERRAASGSVWLFPGAGDINVGHRSKTAAEWFGRIIHELGLYEEGGCLHRLRKSLATHLADNHVNTAYIKDILGHERECVTERHYIGGATLEKKAELLKMVTFGLKPAEACRLIPAGSIEAGEGKVLHLNR